MKKRPRKTHTPTQIKVGTYEIGHEFVDVVAMTNELGGCYYFQPEDGRFARVKIGINHDHWWEVVNVVLHEAMEFGLERGGLKFIDTGKMCGDSGAVKFFFNHAEFAEVCGRVSYFLTKLLPDLATVFDAQNKKKRNR